jgi:hypothetical protein
MTAERTAAGDGAPQGAERSVPQPPGAAAPLGKQREIDVTRTYQGRREGRCDLRHGVQPRSTLSRLQRCGIRRVAASVTVRVKGDVAHWSGVETCGSVWSCPVCSAKIREGRAREIEQAVSGHIAAGGGVAFLTVTVPHDAGMTLAAVWATMQRAWTATWAGKAAVNMRAEVGIVGTIRTVEVTYGRNGWHPHVHALVLTEAPLEVAQEADLFLFTLSRWRRYVAAQGWPQPSATVGLDYDRVSLSAGRTALGRYVAKVRPEDDAGWWGAGRELARADVKRARVDGNLSPFQLAAHAVETGEAWAVRAWREWEAGSKGRRAIMWSPGLRDRLGLLEERTDDELAAEEVGGDVVAVVSGSTFDWLARRGILVDALAVVEQYPQSAPAVLGAFLTALRAPPRVCRGVAPPSGLTC